MKGRFVKPDPYIGITPRKIRVQEHRISNVVKALRGFTLLFATDIHFMKRTDPQKLADMIAAQKADVILFGGDFADTREDALELFRCFSALYAPYGIYAVCGNNDVEAFGRMKDYRKALELFGCEMLADRSTLIVGNGFHVAVGGVQEYKYHHPDTKKMFREKADFRVCVSHYPCMPAFPSDRVPDLLLCGHTHGGQFNLLGITPYTIGFETLGNRGIDTLFPCGFRRIGNTDVLVSKGIGTSRIPLRIGVRPEIHRIVFA